MFDFLVKLLGDPNNNKIKKMLPIVDHINALEPEFIKLTEEEKKETTINELEGVINNTLVSDILNLNIKSYQETEESPIIYYNDIDGDGSKDEGEEVVTYILYSLSSKKINELSSTINEFRFSEIFSKSEREEGILSLIKVDPLDPTTDPTIAELPEAIKDAVSGASIKTLMEKGVITITDEATKTKLATEFDHDADPETDKKALQDFKVNEFIEYSLKSITIPTV